MIGKRPNAVVILNHLLLGGRGFKVTFQGEKHPRTLVLDEEHELCQLVQDDAGKEVLLRVFGVDMGPFVKLCESLSDDDVFLIGAATALATMKDRGITVSRPGQEAS